MAVRKATANDAEYIERKLAILHDQMEKAERYIQEHPWEEAPDNRREAEFRFQKGLTDSLFEWTEKYITMCGIMDVYNKVNEVEGKKTLRSGQTVSGVQQFVKQRAEEDAARLLED